MIDSFHSSGNFSFFQIEVISLWISEQIFPPPALISSAGISSIPDDSFCNTHHCQFLQGTIWSNNGHLVVICTVGVEDSHLGTDMFSMRCGMNPVDHEDMLQVPLFGADLILMWCVITLAVITQLHLWHLYLRVTALSVGDLPAQWL